MEHLDYLVIRQFVTQIIRFTDRPSVLGLLRYNLKQQLEQKLRKDGSTDKRVKQLSSSSPILKSKNEQRSGPAIQVKTMPERHMTQPRQASTKTDDTI